MATPPVIPRLLSTARFYAILDTSFVSDDQLPEVCRAVLSGGAGAVQLRAKTVPTGVRVEMLQSLAPLCAAAGVPLICNDDADAARAVPGVGLHVGQNDLPVRAARAAIGPDRVLGLSTHSLAQVKGALALSDVLTYFAVGPIFATGTKPDYKPVGLELVAEVVALLPTLPWFCIGGINRLNVVQVRSTGARAIVAVSAVLTDPNPAAAVRALRTAMR